MRSQLIKIPKETYTNEIKRKDKTHIAHDNFEEPMIIGNEHMTGNVQIFHVFKLT